MRTFHFFTFSTLQFEAWKVHFAKFFQRALFASQPFDEKSNGNKMCLLSLGNQPFCYFPSPKQQIRKRRPKKGKLMDGSSRKSASLNDSKTRKEKLWPIFFAARCWKRIQAKDFFRPVCQPNSTCLVGFERRSVLSSASYLPFFGLFFVFGQWGEQEEWKAVVRSSRISTNVLLFCYIATSAQNRATLFATKVSQLNLDVLESEWRRQPSRWPLCYGGEKTF